MYVTELSQEELEELKCNYYTEHLLEVEDREPFMSEFANIDEIIDDTTIFEAYNGYVFSEDDFFCTVLPA